MKILGFIRIEFLTMFDVLPWIAFSCGSLTKLAMILCVATHICRLLQEYVFGIMAKIFFEFSNSHYALTVLKLGVSTL